MLCLSRRWIKQKEMNYQYIVYVYYVPSLVRLVIETVYVVYSSVENITLEMSRLVSGQYTKYPPQMSLCKSLLLSPICIVLQMMQLVDEQIKRLVITALLHLVHRC